jgi:Alr-MurF fusion protein
LFIVHNQLSIIHKLPVLPRAWASILGATESEISAPTLDIQHISTDSRDISQPTETLFFALKSEKRDGHFFLHAAYQNGVRAFVISEPEYLSLLPQSTIFYVPDTRLALQQLGAYIRSHFEGQVIGITGSNGKTVVKEWLYQCLSHVDHVIRSPRSYNSQIGVPFSLWLLRTPADIALIEAGVSQRNEMAALAKIIMPDIGVLTHLGTAHDAGFTDKTEKLQEKMQLFESAHTLIAGTDDPLVHTATQSWLRMGAGRRLCRWSLKDSTADVFVHEQGPNNQHCKLSIRMLSQKTREIQLDLPFGDIASLENILTCITTVVALDTPLEDLPKWISQLEPVEMRLEMKAAANGCTLLNDSYNSDITSLKIAMDTAQNLVRNQAVTMILSDLYQSGLPILKLYKEVAQLIENKAFSRIIGVGQDVKVLAQLLPKSIGQTYFDSTEDLLQEIDKSIRFKDELILLKGARSFAFERIARCLQQKNHHAVLEVNLAAMTHNLNVYKRALKPGVKMMVMVKAAGYGSGEAETARLLQHHGVDYLGVAYADEGITLRRSGITLPIMVLNPAPDEFDAMHRYQLEPEIYSMEIWQAAVEFVGTDKTLSIHLKIDTGMHRLGFTAEQIPALCTALATYQDRVKVVSVFSHLSASDKSNFDEFTHTQAQRFMDMYNQIVASLTYTPFRHVVNTGGITRFPEYQYEMVRLGIGLYGTEGVELKETLQVVHTLKARISQIKNVPKGDTIGYNRNGPVLKDARIATINIGYADGLLRAAGNGRHRVRLGTTLVPTIGNICMDMCMLDISTAPDARVGDEVVIFGDSPTAEALAAVYQSITYEVFTGISSRVKRIYWVE